MKHLFFYHKLNKKFLDKFLTSETLPTQSLLFWGEHSLGKTTTALYFAQGLLCEKKKWGGCGECSNCQAFQRGIHPDFLLVRPPDKEFSSISIKDIKGDQEKQGVIQFLSFKPQLSSYRVVIIDEAEKMTSDAQNAFLKTLEEPNPNALIILISDFPQKLLSTIRSRVVSLRFTRAPVEVIKKYLQKEYLLTEEQAEIIARESEGKIGEAVKLLNEDYLKDIKKRKLLLEKLLKSSFLEQSKLLDDFLKENKKELPEVNYTLTIWLKELIRRKNYILARKLFRVYEMINSYNINKQLLLENIFLQRQI